MEMKNCGEKRNPVPVVVFIYLLFFSFLFWVPQEAKSEGSPITESSATFSQYKLQIWKKMLKCWTPPYDSYRCKRPRVVLDLHKSGLVLNADEGFVASDCPNLAKSCINAVWFAAPFGELPSEMGDRVSLCVTLRPLQFKQPEIEVMQTPGLTEVRPLNFSRECSGELAAIVAKMRSGQSSDVSKYFETSHFPASIPFVISKNLWMQVEKSEVLSRRMGSQAISNIVSAISQEWVGDAKNYKRVQELQADLDKALAVGRGLSNKEVCSKLAELSQILIERAGSKK